jgi:hypothetical protein
VAQPRPAPQPPQQKPNGASDQLLKSIQSWLQVLTVVVAAAWGLYTYIQHDNDVKAAEARKSEELRAQTAAQAASENRTRWIEAQKPFLSKQLDLFFETAQVAGRLVTEDVQSPAWKADDLRFSALYWSELTMVEQVGVAKAMSDFKDKLVPIESKVKAGQPVDDKDMEPLRSICLDLAQALRGGVERSWGDAAGGRAIVAPQ